MNNIIEFQNNTPVVSHKVIADNTNNKAVAIANLINKYLPDFEEFGNLHFKNEGLQRIKRGEVKTKTYYLNEQQATLLFTYMRNSEVVRKFKIALVRAFYELKAKASQALEVAPHFPHTMTKLPQIPRKGDIESLIQHFGKEFAILAVAKSLGITSAEIGEIVFTNYTPMAIPGEKAFEEWAKDRVLYNDKAETILDDLYADYQSIGGRTSKQIFSKKLRLLGLKARRTRVNGVFKSIIIGVWLKNETKGSK